MTKFVTYDDLRGFNNALTLNKSAILARASSRIRESKTKMATFLSHSSRDAEFLPGLINLLESHGASVYCDLSDSRMPLVPDATTAKILKDQIASSEKLVVFVTPNSKESKWVPWELGIGDMRLSPSNVALFPASERSSDQLWAKQEYLGLYRRIVWGGLKGHEGNLWMVYDHHSHTADSLLDWFRK